MRAVSAGTRIGEYVLTEKIGAGAFADVWLAHHNVWTEQQVAVKLAREEEYVRYLRREGIILHELDHENILKTLGLDEKAQPQFGKQTEAHGILDCIFAERDYPNSHSWNLRPVVF